MQKLTKRFLGLVMAVVMLVGIMPIQNAHAAENHNGVFATSETAQSTHAAEDYDGGHALSEATQSTYAAEDYNGGYALCLSTQNVYSAQSGGSKIGTVYKNEGITVLWTSGSVAKIEYSTSSGTKQGYLYNPNYYLAVYSNSPNVSNSSVAHVDTTAAVYYGPSSSGYQKVGTVYAGEMVVAFGETDGWTYIEYNTSSGRKRGYMADSCLTTYYWLRLSGNLVSEAHVTNYSAWVSGRQYVYAGPSTQYPTVGYVQDENIIEYSRLYTDADGRTFQYIEYYVGGTSVKKSGYLLL